MAVEKRILSITCVCELEPDGPGFLRPHEPCVFQASLEQVLEDTRLKQSLLEMLCDKGLYVIDGETPLAVSR